MDGDSRDGELLIADVKLISAVETSGTIKLRSHEFGDDDVECRLKELAAITHLDDGDAQISAKERANIFYHEEKIANICTTEATVVENTSQNHQAVLISPRQSDEDPTTDPAQDVLLEIDQSMPISTAGKLYTLPLHLTQVEKPDTTLSQKDQVKSDIAGFLKSFI